MHITIVGSGNVGRALASGWLKTGHSVTFATRDAAGEKAGELRKEGFGVVPLNDAATSTDVIVLAVPWTAVEATIRSLGGFAGKVLIDTTDPLKSGRELAIGFGDSGGGPYRGLRRAHASSKHSAPQAPTTWQTATIPAES